MLAKHSHWATRRPFLRTPFFLRMPLTFLAASVDAFVTRFIDHGLHGEGKLDSKPNWPSVCKGLHTIVRLCIRSTAAASVVHSYSRGKKARGGFSQVDEDDRKESLVWCPLQMLVLVHEARDEVRHDEPVEPHRHHTHDESPRVHAEVVSVCKESIHG